MKHAFLVVINCLTIGVVGAERSAPSAIGEHGWSHVKVLADDSMEGRNTGSPGHKRAAEYVAGQFEKAGLIPAGVS